MYRIDFIISNSGHHFAMAQRIIKSLLTRKIYQCRVLSLCEFRGIMTPTDFFDKENLAMLRISPLRRPARGVPTGHGSNRVIPRLARELAWRLFLERNTTKAIATQPDLVIMFNDAAYPYDRICRLLKDRRIPFLLVQEGIRYKVADEAGDGSHNQGRGGAAAIAAWGETSKDYFIEQGTSKSTIHLTGNPRFDAIEAFDKGLHAKKIRNVLDIGKTNLLFLSNPIDFHGYCTASEKLQLIREFVKGIGPLLSNEDFRLIFKLHGHEKVEDFQAILSDLPFTSRIIITSDIDLYSLFTIGDAAIVFSSTAGLEAMLFELPLGVLEIPGVGFLHDYVSSGAAIGIEWDKPMACQVGRLLNPTSEIDEQVEQYKNRTLATRSGATENIVGLIEGILDVDVAESAGPSDEERCIGY